MTSQGSGAERQSPTKDSAANCAGVRAPSVQEGPCPVCGGPHGTAMFPPALEEALDLYVRACVDFDTLTDWPGCSPDEASAASRKVHEARIALEAAHRDALRAAIAAATGSAPRE